MTIVKAECYDDSITNGGVDNGKWTDYIMQMKLKALCKRVNSLESPQV